MPLRYSLRYEDMRRAREAVLTRFSYLAAPSNAYKVQVCPYSKLYTWYVYVSTVSSTTGLP